MARRDRAARPRRAGGVDERGQPVGAVAGRARVRRLAARVAGDERLDDGAAEGLAPVERDVRDPERMAALARAQHGRRRAAGALGVRRQLVDPEPQRQPDDLAAARALAQQRDGGVDAARHRDGDARGGRAGARARARRRRRAPRAARRARPRRTRARGRRAPARPRSPRATSRAASRNGRPWLRRHAQAAAAVACAQAAAPKRASAMLAAGRRARS